MTDGKKKKILRKQGPSKSVFQTTKIGKYTKTFSNDTATMIKLFFKQKDGKKARISIVQYALTIRR
jgi:hypothetical protein